MPRCFLSAVLQADSCHTNLVSRKFIRGAPVGGVPCARALARYARPAHYPRLYGKRCEKFSISI
jgi:hypothetical protein